MPSFITTQALVAAFAFGVIVNAATASLFLFTKDHGWHSFRDGPRLVLIVFLAGAALWALTDFIAMTVDGNAMPGCQVATSFISGFDQIARVALIQFLVWGTQNGTKTTGQKFIFQGLVLLRFLIGGIIVGMTRPQINSMYCVGTALVKPLSMAGIVFDCFMAFMLLVKVFIQGSFKAVPEGGHSIVRRKVLIFGIISFAIWSALSGPMLLGYDSLILITRTLLPAIGVGIIIAILAFNHTHLSFAPQRAASAEQGGPFSGGARHTRDPASQDSGYNSDTYAPPSRYEEIKGETVVRIDAFGQNTRSNRGFNHTKAPSVGQIGRPHLQQGPAGVGFDHQSTFAPSRQAPAPAQAPRALSKKGGKIQISAPVLLAHAETGQNPLTRIATIDLATAARNEKERREMPAQPLASNYLAPGQGGKAPLSPNSLMKNPGSVKRKQIAKSTDQSVPSEPLLDPAEMVTATSSQLSPGVEELRRRSPRHAPEGTLSPRGVTSPQVPAKSTRRSQHALSALTASDLKTRPSSTLPLTPPPKSPKRAQPPLSPFGRTTSLESQAPALPGQRGSVKVVIKPTPNAEKLASPAVPPKDFTVASVRPMNGLPRNPRMAAAKPITAQQKTPKSQTVMLLKNIEYDDPAAVREIVNGAGKPTTKRAVSVVHRPRPIPRQSAMDRQIFPAEGSPSPKHSHKRSLSGGSGISRKSILQSVPTSPSKLPPLPPVPQTAGQPGRPLPNDTRSMTFDEKMDIFYSNTGEQPAKEMRRRSSSVPELPELPAAFRERSRSRSQSGDALRDSTHHTDKSSRSSIRTASLLDFPEVPVQRTKMAPVSKFSVDTTVGEGMMWATTTKARLEGIKRQSSPVLPIEALKSPSNGSELKSHDDDTTTLWGSIHSPVKSTMIQKASAIEVPPVPKIGKCPEADTKGLDDIFKVKTADAKADESHMMMTVVLDTSDQASPVVKQGVSADLDRVLEADSRPVSWHRRIGDECPMFSGRQDSIKRRKNPPPAPLPLTRTADRRPRLVQAPEASPLEAPEKALEAIQEQLRKFEDPNRESTGSQQLQRMTLLANLEAEMGMHENQWQQMQSRLDRDSFSTTAGSPRKRESRPDSLAVSIVAQADDRSQRPERRTSRSSKSLSQNKRTSSDASSYSTFSVENEHEWDEDLAEAQAEYLKHRFQLVSHLSEKTTSMLVSSPKKTAHVTQPARLSSQKNDEVALMAVGYGSSPRLWQPSKGATVTRLTSTPSLWSGPGSAAVVDKTFHIEEQPEPLRRNLGRVIKPLTIESDRLWMKKQKRGSFGPQKGLWASTQIARPMSTTSIPESTPQTPSTPSKTLARKPSRRSKRVTLLPDILENPEPMPDKRGTLAIYQFPWGEKSDSASIRPRPQMFMAMPGTMTSGRSSQQAQQAVPQLTNPFAFDAENYSASFFDDEDEGDNFPESQALSDEEDRYDDEEDEDSDDFDETTLWEIASLLKSNQVPSRESLLPEDWRYTAEPAQIDYSEPVKVSHDDKSRSLSSQDMAPDSAVTDSLESAQSSLWSSQQSPVSSQDVIYMANPDEYTWQSYEAAMPVAVRAPTRTAQPDSVESDSLWMAEPEVAVAVDATSLWEPKKAEPVVGGLWAQRPRAQQLSKGLAEPTEDTWAAYQVGSAGVVRASTRSSQPATIESTSLWQPMKSDAMMTGLWAHQVPVSTLPKGLANPSQEVWASYNVGLIGVTRAPTRPSQTSAIESTDMWKIAPATAKTRASGLWTTETSDPISQLWSAPSPQGSAHAAGLAQPPTWASYNVELTGAARAPTRPSQTSTIESTTMWKVAPAIEEATTSGLWATKSSQSSTQLWSAPPPNASTPIAGLAQPSTPSWMSYTAPSLSPVRAKPRLDNVAGPVVGLASSALWDNDHPSPTRDDWITLSTVRARSPSTSSVESAASDASSVKSNTTKASTVASIFSSFWRRKRGVSDAKSDDSVPEVPEVPSLPVVAEKQEAAPLVPNVVSFHIHAAPTVPLRRQYRPNVAFRVDWDAALQEAIDASKPKPSKRQRPTATPADWTAALAAAVPRSSPVIKASVSPSPQLWTSTPLKSPLPTTTSLWASHLTRAPRAAFPADCSMLPNPSRRGRSGSILQQDGPIATMDAELQVPHGLTEQSLWRRSVAMEKAEIRTRDWLATESN